MDEFINCSQLGLLSRKASVYMREVEKRVLPQVRTCLKLGVVQDSKIVFFIEWSAIAGVMVFSAFHYCPFSFLTQLFAWCLTPPYLNHCCLLPSTIVTTTFHLPPPSRPSPIPFTITTTPFVHHHHCIQPPRSLIITTTIVHH